MTASELYHQATIAETVEGDLERAVTLYHRLVRQYAHERDLAARSLLAIGRIQEVLGDPEAASFTYMQLVRGFTEYREEVATAEKRLRQLQGQGERAGPLLPGSLPRTRQAGELPWELQPLDVLSDGTRLLTVSLVTGDLLLTDPTTGRSRKLTDIGDGGWYEGSGGKVVAARADPEGSRVAYALLDGEGISSLRVLDMSTGEDRFLYEAPEGSLAEPHDWDAATGTIVGVETEGDSYRSRLLSWDPEDGTPSLIGNMASGPPLSLRVSPTGAGLVYDPALVPREDFSSIYYRPEPGGPPPQTIPLSIPVAVIDWDERGGGFFGLDVGLTPSRVRHIPVTDGVAQYNGEVVYSVDTGYFSLGRSGSSCWLARHPETTTGEVAERWENLPGIWLLRWSEFRVVEELAQGSRPMGSVRTEALSAWSSRSYRRAELRNRWVYLSDEALGRGGAQGHRFAARQSLRLRATLSPEEDRVAWVPSEPLVRWHDRPRRILISSLCGGEVREYLLPGDPAPIAPVWTEDGGVMVAAYDRQGTPSLLMLDPASGHLEERLRLEPGWIRQLRPGPEGCRVLVEHAPARRGDGPGLLVVDVRTGHTVAAADPPGEVTSASLGPRGEIAVAVEVEGSGYPGRSRLLVSAAGETMWESLVGLPCLRPLDMVWDGVGGLLLALPVNDESEQIDGGREVEIWRLEGGTVVSRSRPGIEGALDLRFGLQDGMMLSLPDASSGVELLILEDLHGGAAADRPGRRRP